MPLKSAKGGSVWGGTQALDASDQAAGGANSLAQGEPSLEGEGDLVLSLVLIPGKKRARRGSQLLLWEGRGDILGFAPTGYLIHISCF